MRIKPAMALSLFLGFACAGSGWGQPPGPGGGAPGGGSTGGGGGGPGGGGFGFGRGGGGGFRGMRRDPGALFDQFAGGKSFVTKADVPVWLQNRFDQWAQAAGVTNGQLTRAQFVSAMQQGFGGRGGGSGGEGNGQDNGNRRDPSAWADNAFRRLDTNGDGFLNNDELAAVPDLRAERDKWDTDKNGLIDLNEFKAYFQARMQQWQQDRDSGNGPAPLFVPGVDPEPAEPEIKKPIAYRAGKLPKELPEWFQRYDTDGDAQIGLYEWKATERPLEEFMKMDRNGDGFLTVEEVLYYMASQKNGNASAANGAGPGPAGPGPGLGGPSGGQNRNGFFNGGGRNGGGRGGRGFGRNRDRQQQGQGYGGGRGNSRQRDAGG
jgi:Ca2+-binding EF-hand superfamily protein